ncbi:hypothetical protein [Asticcacaulis sp. AND118]|uniref:hypothetical protein n=1 Tax=Asticcacaulis sp. AND118 TaxID=2840468 RepID=UPI001CFFFA95|nr:hypothetical protein [Asticcacaulis sp. AND118]UDF03858.1 hypothetical protein LH365_02085 [Asticcacaulis sp. AND118]
MLTARRPLFLWFVLALLAATLLHACVWFAARLFAAQGFLAAAEGARQMGLSLFWMVCTASLWLIQGPKNRFHAVLHVLGCAFLVCALGSFMAFSNLTFSQNFEFSLKNMLVFGLVAVPMVVSQVLLALPSAILFQMILLGRPPRLTDEAVA